jgi:VanZ family protein
MKSRWKTILGAWLPVLMWLGILAVESTSMLSSSNTSGFLYPILKAIFGRLDPRTFNLIHGIMRKFGHFAGYAVLSLLFFRALVCNRTKSATSLMRNNYMQMAAFSIGFTFLVASLDEWHQSLLPSRTGAFSDVLLDTFGAVAVQSVVLIFLRVRSSRLRSSAINEPSMSVK